MADFCLFKTNNLYHNLAKPPSPYIHYIPPGWGLIRRVNLNWTNWNSGDSRPWIREEQGGRVSCWHQLECSTMEKDIFFKKGKIFRLSECLLIMGRDWCGMHAFVREYLLTIKFLAFSSRRTIRASRKPETSSKCSLDSELEMEIEQQMKKLQKPRRINMGLIREVSRAPTEGGSDAVAAHLAKIVRLRLDFQSIPRIENLDFFADSLRELYLQVVHVARANAHNCTMTINGQSTCSHCSNAAVCSRRRTLLVHCHSALYICLQIWDTLFHDLLALSEAESKLCISVFQSPMQSFRCVAIHIKSGEQYYRDWGAGLFSEPRVSGTCVLGAVGHVNPIDLWSQNS